MKLESQVCSIELAKRLKSLGVKQDAQFCWRFVNTPHPDIIWANQPPDKDGCKYAAAFTVAELGEMLSVGTLKIYSLKFDSGAGRYWKAERNSITDGDKICIGNTEADARAKMLIYLIEQGIVKP